MQIDPSDLVKRGGFYFIYDRPPHYVMEDKTKRGLEVREHVVDKKYGVESDRGMIYDMDGIGHKVGIRWFFPKSQYSLEQVTEKAEEMDKRYRAIREMTCPDDE
ncbi:hypothetical protein [Nitrososphaera sp.]|uniref:hypothetical protein n=1 Tax=Nitrososphaera sp. TaxID=1971748 RepID=UPI0025EEDB70|nr:hypothetical protein [Nitrososphaera sp.]